MLSSLGGIGLYVVAGAVIGVVVAAMPATFSPATRPFVSLLKATRPLFLSLFAVVAIGTVHLAIGWQVAINAALLLIAWHLVIKPEGGQLKQTLGWGGLPTVQARSLSRGDRPAQRPRLLPAAPAVAVHAPLRSDRRPCLGAARPGALGLDVLRLLASPLLLRPLGYERWSASPSPSPGCAWRCNTA